MFTDHSSKTIRFICTVVLLVFAALPVAHAVNGTYQQHNLVSDGSVAADNTDPNLVNPWGIAFNPFSFAWIAANGTGNATVYDGAGKPQSPVVKVPTARNTNGEGTPTGIVFNGAPIGFEVFKDGVSAPSQFIFATEDGTISGWAPTVDPTNAIRMIDNSESGAVYKGLALGAAGNGVFLYAADFHNNRIDVFDSAFKRVQPESAFFDPNLPEGFAPFNVQAINGNLYVAYAKQDSNRRDDVAGPGSGYVNVFDLRGNLIKRVTSQGALNSPWGMALAPAGFGTFSGRLLVGNFGDGKINAYDVVTGDAVGPLTRPDQQPVQIDGLWGLAFGNGVANQPVNSLFFTAGPGNEEHGLYGRIDVAQ